MLARSRCGIGAGEDAELRGRHGQGTAAAERVVEAHQAAPHQRVIGLVQGADARDLVDRALLQMVLQIAPDARPVEHGFDPERRQPFRRPDAGAVQHLDRSDRAGAQDHFAFGARLDHFAALHEAHADGAAVLDDQAVDQHVLFQPQIGAVQYRLQEAARRRPAAAALLVDVEIADALIVAGVEIGDAPDTHLFGGVADRVEDRPGQPRRLDPPAAAGAVVLALAQKMILQPAERGQHVVVAPARRGRAGASGRSRRPVRASRSWR